jgi:hypothetical protein
MSTDDNKTSVVAASMGAKSLRRFKKFLPIAVPLLIVVLIAGGFFGFKWFQHYQASQREKRYQATVSQLTTLNRQGKSNEVITVAQKYLAGKPEAKYQTRPTYFLALAYMGTNQLDKAKPMLERLAADTNLPRDDKPAVLSALILIGQSKKETNIEPYLVQMIQYLDETAKLPQNKRQAAYYMVEKHRYQMVLDSVRAQKK